MAFGSRVCDPRMLELFEKPLWLISGNCDMWPSWPYTRQKERGGHVFHLEHIPLEVAPKGVTAVRRGHTHIPRDETDFMGVRWLNSGSVSSPRYEGPPSFAWLSIDQQQVGAPYSWELVALTD